MAYCSLRRCRLAPSKGWLLLAALLGFGVCPSLAQAADVETREFHVSVDGKPAGQANMTFNRQEDGVTTVSVDTQVKITIAFYTYQYTYRGREVWKDGRLQRFDSTCNDDGKRFTVTAFAEHDNLKVRVNNQEKIVRGDIWLTSYWNKPEPRYHNQTVAILDADTAKELSAQVVHVGPEHRSVAGQMEQVQHYRLTGKSVNMDLWYDSHNRMVRQEFVEQGHRTLLELTRVRR